ncbi:hypothetical protein D3C72_1408160 [compost metagenome]
MPTRKALTRAEAEAALSDRRLAIAERAVVEVFTRRVPREIDFQVPLDHIMIVRTRAASAPTRFEEPRSLRPLTASR